MGSRSHGRQRRTDWYFVRSLFSGSLSHKFSLYDNRSTIESLLEAKFQPRRTVVLAFGFDEESAGSQVKFLDVFQCPGHLKEQMPDRVLAILH